MGLVKVNNPPSHEKNPFLLRFKVKTHKAPPSHRNILQIIRLNCFPLVVSGTRADQMADMDCWIRGVGSYWTQGCIYRGVYIIFWMHQIVPPPPFSREYVTSQPKIYRQKNYKRCTWYLYSFGMIFGRCSSSWSPALAAIVENPKAAPFLEFQVAL